MNYNKELLAASSESELSAIRESFEKDCERQKKKIAVIDRVKSIKNFGDVNNIMESVSGHLFKTKKGRGIIMEYTRAIKENKALTGMYAMDRAMKGNRGKVSGDTFISEMKNYIPSVSKEELGNGMKKIIPIMVEAVSMIGFDDIDWIDKSLEMSAVNESASYIMTNRKGMHNMDSMFEFADHEKRISEYISEGYDASKKDGIDVNMPLDSFKARMVAISSEGDSDESIMEEIGKSGNGHELFEAYKSACMEKIGRSIKESTGDARKRLETIKGKLETKKYTENNLVEDIRAMKSMAKILS